MAQLLLKIISALIFWGIFIYVILYVQYPESLTQASVNQLLYFFIPLFLGLTFTINLILKSIISCITISFGIITLLILKALDSLNIATVGLTVIAIGLLFSYFKTPQSLTSGSKIPKLTRWRKQSRHPEEPSRRRRI